jgi:predicted 2-oxoglutarate/Fe(II)-dependent dioxygenase YbiX
VNLIFHGLLKDEKFGQFGIPLNGEIGMLIAFPSAILHEVSQITAGTSFVVNSGYYKAPT